MSSFKYDLSTRSFSPVPRKRYEYLVKANDIKSAYARIKFVTQPQGPKKWAKVKLAKLVDKLYKKDLEPDSLGYITISGSVGDTIKSGFPEVKMEKRLKSDNREIPDDEWDKMWWQK